MRVLLSYKKEGELVYQRGFKTSDVPLRSKLDLLFEKRYISLLVRLSKFKLRITGMSGKKTKEIILREAFKLFSAKTYEQVTFTELENTTQLTRGAIMYHFKTKELIFKSMCDKYLLEEGSILDKLKSIDPNTSLKKFIDIYIESIEKTKESTQSIGINNINRALINITNQATHYYPSFEIKALKWQIVQVQMWKDVLYRAATHNEIRKDIDFEIASDLFEDIYCGISYAGIVYPDGIEVERLRKALYFIYNLVKA